MKHARTIAEYFIYKWLEENNFVLSAFQVEAKNNKVLLTDTAGEQLEILYENGEVNTRIL